MRVDSRFSTLKVRNYVSFPPGNSQCSDSRNFNVLEHLADPCYCYAVVLKELHEQFTFVQHFNLLYPLALLNRETVIDLTHIPRSRSMPTAGNKSGRENKIKIYFPHPTAVSGNFYLEICVSNDRHDSTPAKLQPLARRLLNITSPNRSFMFTCS